MDQKVNQVDAHIVSSKRAIVLLIIISFGFAYFGIQQIFKTRNFEKEVLLELVLILSDAARGNLNNETKFLKSDWPNFSLTANNLSRKMGNEIWRLTEESLKFKDEEKSKLKQKNQKFLDLAFAKRDKVFSDDEVEAGKLYRSIPVVFSIRRQCDLMKLKLIPGPKIFLFTGFYFSWVKSVERENVQFWTFGIGCIDRMFERNNRLRAFIFYASSDKIGIALPEKILSRFINSEFVTILNSPFKYDGPTQALFTTSVSKYVKIDETFRLIDLRALELIALNYFSNKHGQKYGIGDLPLVRKRMGEFNQDSNRTQIFGVNLDIQNYLRFVPIGIFFISFYLWRQLRAIVKINPVITKQNWTALDTEDLAGMVAAKFWALFPLISISSVYLIYTFALDTVLLVFGYEISMKNLLTGSIPDAVGPGWYGFDWLIFMSFPLFLAQLIILYLCTRTALIIVKNNQQGSFISEINRFYQKTRPNKSGDGDEVK